MKSGTWFPHLVDGETLLDQVANHRPDYADAMREVETAIWSQGVVEAEILELCRLRIVQLLGSDAPTPPHPAAAGLEPMLVERLRQWPTDPAFTERHRTCLGLAEQVAIDAQGVSDEQAKQVVAAVGDGGFLVLIYACGFFETTQRARMLLDGRGCS